MPKQPDLVILEHLPYLEGKNPEHNLLTLEQLINRLQYNFNLSSFPPIIFLNMHAVDWMEANFTLSRGQAAYDNANQCVRDGTLCPTLCPDNFVGLPLASSNATSAELITNRAATHYGFASLSYTNLIAALMQSSARGSLSECQVFATVFGDLIHPNPRGQMLVTDLLVSYLAGAHEHFHSHATNLSLGSPQEHHRGIAPLDPKSLMVPVMRCFGTMHAMFGNELVSQDLDGGLNTTSKIDVVKAEGWTYIETDGGKLKPGWVSTIPGSELWMAIDTDFGKPTDPRFISLFVLSSYQHMGQAEVACVSGCICDNSIIDGHIPDHKHSVPRHHEFRVYQQHNVSLGGSKKGNINSLSRSNSNNSTNGGSRCIIQVKVMQESISGEHKVKVMQLAIKSWVNVSAALPQVARS